MKIFTLSCFIFFCCLPVSFFAMSHQDDDQPKKSSKRYAMYADKATLTIHGNNKVKQITFDDEITALNALETLPYVLVGLNNGSVILLNIHNKKLSSMLPNVHSMAITALYADENFFFTADAAGINYIWHNLWSNRLHAQQIRTLFPVLHCEGTKDFLALQHPNRLIGYPEITILERSTLRRKTLFGSLQELLPDNTLLIEQDKGIFKVTKEGEILCKYANASETDR